jgi:hypothetical protein
MAQSQHCIIAKLPGGNVWSDKFDDEATMTAVIDWLKLHQIGAEIFVTTDPLIVLEPTAEPSNE